jgi:hypothetical protein
MEIDKTEREGGGEMTTGEESPREPTVGKGERKIEKFSKDATSAEKETNLVTTRDTVLKTKQAEAPTRGPTNAPTAGTTKRIERKDTTIEDTTTNRKETLEMTDREGMSAGMSRSVILGNIAKTGIRENKERETMFPRSNPPAERIRIGDGVR